MPVGWDAEDRSQLPLDPADSLGAEVDHHLLHPGYFEYLAQMKIFENISKIDNSQKNNCLFKLTIFFSYSVQNILSSCFSVPGTARAE